MNGNKIGIAGHTSQQFQLELEAVHHKVLSMGIS